MLVSQEILVDAICSNTSMTADQVKGHAAVVDFVAAQCLYLIETDCLEMDSWAGLLWQKGGKGWTLGVGRVLWDFISPLLRPLTGWLLA